MNGTRRGTRRTDHARRTRVVECGARALRVEIDAAHVANGVLLLLAGLVSPEERIAADQVDQRPTLRRPVAEHEKMTGVRQPLELGVGGRAADEIDHRDLTLGERLFLAVADAEIQVAVDEVSPRLGVKDDVAALALAVGEDERRALDRPDGQRRQYDERCC